MKNIFKKLNIQLEEKTIQGNSTNLLIINNPDGTPRWICNANSKKPLFLKFYSVATFKAKLFAFAIKLVFILRLQKVVFKTEKIYYKNLDNSIINVNTKNWALFTGTIGPNNKLLVFVKMENESFFYKIANSLKSIELIENEEKTLANISSKSFVIPKQKRIQKNILKLQDISDNGKREATLTQTHKNVLSEIYKETSQEMYLSELPIYKETLHKLQLLDKRYDTRLPNGLIEKLHHFAKIISNKKITVALAHNDFTSWNMYIKNNQLAIYDWELSKQKMPIGFDAFHFILQQGVLVNKDSWKKIKKEIYSKITPDLVSNWTKNNTNIVEDYLKLYLLINTVSQLQLFYEQPKWHTQIGWLLTTWSNAIGDFINVKEQQRGLLVVDIFDFLKESNYAAIKFPNAAPNTLSEYSDIDICIEKSNLKPILHYLKEHSFVANVSVIKKSFMAVVQILLKDGTILSLDLIWKFKRKSLVFLDATKILKKAYTNSYGVKQLDLIDLVRYIGLFYGLNSTKIPSKYKAYVQVLQRKNNTLDNALYVNYLEDTFKNKQLINYLKKQNDNKYLKSIANKINYVLDSVKQYFSSKGMVITFSGVDGAGKSTIIEKIKLEIEKKLRKQVIVIRHRPSLLPILSVWTKGKEQAHKDVISGLPRQGKNNSTLSSFIRFAYYYTDYLFGQFYIYTKYILRGKVVLYDRYYFDFINDSKRSNIQLPKSITKFGYKFLLQPDINIFLYANPEVILARKKELTKETILTLTSDYKSLFKILENQSSKQYVSIENIELEKTLNIIMDKAIAKIAC